jgi:DNA-binding CsgD family transcriptional regulator
MKASSSHLEAVEHHRCETWLNQVEQACSRTVIRGTQPDLEPRIAHARAEFARLQGEPCKHHWTALVEAWDALAAPYEAAYSRLRLAEAILKEDGSRPVDARSSARTLLSAARDSAMATAASPLVQRIDALDRRAHLNLTSQRSNDPTIQRSNDPTQAGFGRAAGSLGLTERELEVLHLVAAGRSNGQIGQALFISRKTASVHISNILRKLGVSNRIEAAAIATNNARYRPQLADEI